MELSVVSGIDSSDIAGADTMPTPLQPQRPEKGEQRTELYFVAATMLAMATTMLHTNATAFILVLHLLQ
ncbi:hypothetical protein [Aminobacter aminovorans]|jgi:hypothetical protein|uniref:hypothetical protein n=1 Tax=Aminobacter aminovorans TaxID=83263 RepID=UPI00285DC833|nr:hypothetical protein [Aminobacter aminovorans]MDR7223840.1 cyclophilin family peptidyl-prolyl cis-trans isomerase [Aminobacter aminovorans]